MKSIITDLNDYCYICGAIATETHHCVFGRGIRPLAEKYGLTVRLCHNCHQGTYGVHGRDGKAKKEYLQQVAQMRWEERYGTREEFIKIFGRSYI